MSTEDITKCKRSNGETCFEYLEEINPKTYLSAVEKPLEALREAAQYKKQVNTHLNANGLIGDIDLSNGGYVFISLSDNLENEDKTSTLSRHGM